VFPVAAAKVNQIALLAEYLMTRLFRVLALCATMIVGASVAATSNIPSPFFPPDPWEPDPETALVSNNIPSPFFPPDPWEPDPEE